MRYILLTVCALVQTVVFAQDFNSVRKPKSLNSIRIRDTVAREVSSKTDTVYVATIDSNVFYQPTIATEPKKLKNSLIPFATPLVKLNKTSAYGYRVHPILRKWMFHSGVDLASRSDTVYSMLSGVVKDSGYSPTLGYYVRTEHSYGEIEILYAHLSEYHYRKGEIILAGAPLGITGSTGRSTGDHLHLSVYRNGHHVDPIPFMAKILEFNKHQTIINNGKYTINRDHGFEGDI